MARVGQLYTFDALLAVTLLIGAVLMIGEIQGQQTPEVQTRYAAQDAILSLNAITIDDRPEAWVQNVTNGTQLTGNDSLLYAMGYLWTINDSRAENLSALLNSSIPARFGLRVEIEGDQLFLRNSSERRRVSAAVQQITGIDQGKPAAGTSSSAYLRNIRNKRTSSFALFGGFVGQGNITHTFSVPADVNASRVDALELELDVFQEFDLLINGNPCDTLTPSEPNMTPDYWDVSGCNGSIQGGLNNVTLEFDDVQDAYVSGGYFKASYRTDELVTTDDSEQTTYNFPEINGVVNLYDAMSVPQTLRNITIQLHYESPDNESITYLTIGERTVYTGTEKGEFNITLTDANLTSLDYELLSNKTVPVRFASYNATTRLVSSGNADVVIITDLSGSMKHAVEDWSLGDSGAGKDCETGVFGDDTIRRTFLAKCLDKEVVDIVLPENETGNRIWLNYFHSNDIESYDPADAETVKSYIDSFPQQGKDETCLACALSDAYEIFESQSAPNRSRFVILMTDGLPTHCTAAGCNARSTDYGSQECVGLCDGSGSCSPGPSPPICTDSSCDPAISNAEIVAQDLHDDFNTTIHTVAFGPVETCNKATQLLIDIANYSNGTFGASNSSVVLREIYQNISQSILDSISFESQTALVPESGVAPSTLYGDSYIRLEHDQVFEDPGQGDIEIVRQTPHFGRCDPTVDFPEDLQLQQALVTSYSGPHWTDLVQVDGVTVYNLSDFFVDYSRLGDPYRVNIPVGALSQTSDLVIGTGDSATNYTGCSDNNSMIYRALVPAASASTPVLENAQGCVWSIENDEGVVQTVPVPEEYAGTNTCSYTNTSRSYNATDATQVAVYRLLEKIDFDDDGRIFVSLESEDLEIILTRVDSVPYLWGPVLVRAEVWQ